MQSSWNDEMRLEIRQTLDGAEEAVQGLGLLREETHEHDFLQTEHEALLQFSIDSSLWRSIHLSALLAVPTHNKKIDEVEDNLGQHICPRTLVRWVEECVHRYHQTFQVGKDGAWLVYTSW